MPTFSKFRSFWAQESVSAYDAYPEYDGHESVIFIRDAETGLRGFIAIHNTNRGPAVGGTRFWNYSSDEEALRDALRLSRAMSYKCALADVPYGGGKAVLIAPKGTQKDEKYLAAYAKRLATFGCGFYTGEDVGLDEDDIRILSKHSTCIIGRPDVGELPAKWAAISVFVSMKAALESVFGSDSFSGKRIAIKGLGNVGFDLAKLVVQAGATVIATDISQTRIALAQKEIPTIQIVQPEHIMQVSCDVFAPCALGGDLSSNNIALLQSKIVCGAANNQLISDHSADQLHERGILYIPDYVANAGGLINVVDELNASGYDKKRVEEKVTSVRATVAELIETSRTEDVSTERVAGEIARSRIGI